MHRVRALGVAVIGGLHSKDGATLRGGAEGGGGSFMSWTTDPDGNWSEPQKLFGNYKGAPHVAM